MMRARTRLIAWVWSLVVLALPACGHKSDDRPLCFPVRGQLFYNGKPMVGASVIFHALPLNRASSRTNMPAARVDKDGSFQVTSYDLHDGAPAGDYAVTVFWSGESGRPAPDLLRNRHSDPNRPVAKVAVQAADVQLDPIQLKGPPVNMAASSERR
jgi:hypothetical protein